MTHQLELGPQIKHMGFVVGGLFVNSMMVWSLLPKLCSPFRTVRGERGFAYCHRRHEGSPAWDRALSSRDSEWSRLRGSCWTVCRSALPRVNWCGLSFLGPTWMLNYVFCLSLFSHFTPLYFLSFHIFVHLSRGTIFVLNKDRENMDLFS